MTGLAIKFLQPVYNIKMGLSPFFPWGRRSLHTLNQESKHLFFGRLWFAFGLHASFPAPLLDEMDAGRAVKGVLADRFYSKSRARNLNQRLICGNLPLIWV
jgi:hypothetical protein